MKKEKNSGHGLEKEIEEAIQEEKEHVEEGQKIAEAQEQSNGVKQEMQEYQKKEQQEKYAAEKPQIGYIENQEFYIKKDEDFDKIRETIQEIKSQNPAMSRVDDSDVYEIEPETKKLKLRKRPRMGVERLKEKKVILD